MNATHEDSMDTTDGQQPELRYDFGYTWHSTYGKAARLLAEHVAPGLVIDLGCGPGVFSQPLAELGFDYLGFDTDTAALAAATERGIRVEELDLTDLLTDLDDVSERVTASVAGTEVRAVSLLDTIEHLTHPDDVLAGIAGLIDRLIDRMGAGQDEAPVLLVSIPNVAHFDLGAKLLMGRWDVTEVGLLDDTHITLFTEARVHDVMTRAGFEEIGANDNLFHRTEQHFPEDHPALERATPLSQLLRSLRRRGAPGNETYQFIRCYRRVDADRRAELVASLPPRSSGRPAPSSDDTGQPFCSVVVRTEGGRPSLVDALTSLAAQTDRDVEVLLMVHHDDPAVQDSVQGLVHTFEPSFAELVRVVHVVGGGRSRPLNEALRLACGRYVAILDDDDIVTAHWIETFRDAAERCPGTVVRAPCLVQWTERTTGVTDVAPVTGFEAVYPLGFDYLDHVRRNRSPSCSYAIPMGAIRALDVWFDEDLDACEDWKFLMQIASCTGVTDADEVTSIYRRSRDGDGSDGVVAAERWAHDHLTVAHQLAAEPSIVPAGALLKVRALYEAIEESERREAAAQEEVTALRNRIDALERSRFWTMTSPLRRLAAMRGRVRRRRG
jgi:SAM-dependent methyltransferase